ncbi:hypothetical protein GCM10010211_60780 [Streptomyces albospinus]|uniref:Uncharacterized protein n=1 Tax=Streptomyces albospinus TaxID=285515 RepID=A0ABQ2VH06_9ACTN|nr:hypothetical protein [Streptomyces albospinus]GGU86542.1 hypothetical protein GCM10010211_60780 [Streptomyces albospinus]
MDEYTSSRLAVGLEHSSSLEKVGLGGWALYGIGRDQAIGAGAGYRCEAVAHAPHEGHSVSLGLRSAATPRLALRWLRGRATDITDQLDAPAARPVRHWLSDQAAHEYALLALTRGDSYLFTIYDEATRYTLSVSPAWNAK